jgi:hypothetical protein
MASQMCIFVGNLGSHSENTASLYFEQTLTPLQVDNIGAYDVTLFNCFSKTSCRAKLWSAEQNTNAVTKHNE